MLHKSLRARSPYCLAAARTASEGSMLKPRMMASEAKARSISLLVMSLAAASRKRGCTLSCGREPMAAFTASKAPVASACTALCLSARLTPYSCYAGCWYQGLHSVLWQGAYGRLHSLQSSCRISLHSSRVSTTQGGVSLCGHQLRRGALIPCPGTVYMVSNAGNLLWLSTLERLCHVKTAHSNAFGRSLQEMTQL